MATNLITPSHRQSFSDHLGLYWVVELNFRSLAYQAWLSGLSRPLKKVLFDTTRFLGGSKFDTRTARFATKSLSLIEAKDNVLKLFVSI